MTAHSSADASPRRGAPENGHPAVVHPATNSSTGELLSTLGVSRLRRSRHRLSSLIAVTGGNIATLVIGLMSGVIAARILGPGPRGEYVTVLTWANVLAMLLAFGVTQAIVTYRGEDRDLTSLLIIQTAGTLVLASALFGGIALSGSQAWLTLYGVVGGLALTLAGLLTAYASSLAQRKGAMAREFQSVRIIPPLFGTGSLLIVAVAGSRDPNVWLFCVGLSFLVPACFLLLHQLGGIRKVMLTFQGAIPPALIRDAMGAFATVIGGLIIYRLDAVLVAAWLPSASVGLYAVAVTTGSTCAAIGQAVSMTAFSELRRINDSGQRHAVVRNSAIRAIVLTSAISVPLAIGAPFAIDVVYGSEYSPAAGAARILAIAAVPLAVDYVLIHALLSISRGPTVALVHVVTGSLTIGLLMAAIATESLEFVALVSLAVYSFSAMILYRVFAVTNRRPVAA